MHQLLYSEQEKFKAVFQNASLGILVINHRGLITLANDFLLRQFAYEDASELIGQKMEILIPKRHHHQHVQQRNHYMEYPVTRPMGMGRDLFGVKKDGTEIPLEISLSSYTNSEGVFTIAFISDISERIRVEEELSVQRSQLSIINKKMEALNGALEEKVAIRTAKLQEALKELEASKEVLSQALNKEKELGDLKSAFVSMASHEFKTPLSTILSSASLIAKYTLTEEQFKRDKHVQRIKSSVMNLNGLLNEFLSLGKIEEGRITTHPTHFEIDSFIQSQISEMAEIFKSGQSVGYTHTGKKEVYLDEHLFRNILINLISNAVKFSAKDRPIFIQTAFLDRELHFSIKDQGMGISQKDQKHLFEIFFRASNAVNIPGTGLGLHIVFKYVEMMHGHITIKSELEKGSEVKIIFIQ
jgi:PAS domain S-box-containing protein